LTILIVIVGWASRPSFLDGRDAHPTIKIKIVSYLIHAHKQYCGLFLMTNRRIRVLRKAIRQSNY
ncbi:hypothetical protein QUB07_20255, partial [Microcoleus sp. F8-C5]